MAVGGIATIAGLAASGFRQTAEACVPGKHDHDHTHDGHEAVVEQEFKCRGRQVQILRYGTGAEVEKVLVMDGQAYCEHVFSAVGDRYSSHLLCFRETRTARALVRRLIDNDGVLFKL